MNKKTVNHVIILIQTTKILVAWAIKFLLLSDRGNASVSLPPLARHRFKSDKSG